MEFKIFSVGEDGAREFYYDNVTNILKNQDGVVYEFPDQHGKEQITQEIFAFDTDKPLLKSRSVRILKIQLGLSCNYSCTYCSQRFVERADETTKNDIDEFMQKLENLEFDESQGLRIEFWGGEPFVYWQTLKPLAARLKQKFNSWEKKPRYSVITNGSVLDDEKIDWIVDNLDAVAVSHDGPGQYVRGPDPFDDPKMAKNLKELYSRMGKGRMSFNAMLHASNMSRKDIYDWFVEKLGDEDVALGEGGIVDAYDEGGIELSLRTKKQQFEYRRKCVEDIIHSEDKSIGFHSQIKAIDNFTVKVLSHKDNHISTVTQKCGMDDVNTISIDLKGNVLTCQNVSSVAINSNNEPHLGGNISDMDNVKITSSTHWKNRNNCSDCPVLHICRGSCMFAQNEYFEMSCNNAYSDSIAKFALSLKKITGYLPIYIDNMILPPERRDIWGDQLKHEEETKAKRVIPIIAA